MTTDGTIEIAVIGAGPYGLATAAHLANAGHEVLAFGQTLEFWRTQTPAKMLLRSPLRGSDIGHPDAGFGYRDYERALGNVPVGPIPVERFLAYGDWFHRNAVSAVDPRNVNMVRRDGDRFRVVVGDDELVASRVVVAAGVGTFARRPSIFAGADPDLVSHTLDHHDLSPLAGKRVTVVGGGQSALESAALLHELGAEVDVLVRNAQVRALREGSWTHRVWIADRILHAAPDVGPALRSHVIAHPSTYRRMPRKWQDDMGVRAVAPAGAGWLQPRLREIPIRTGAEVTEVVHAGDQLKLHLDDGSTQAVDHVLLGTGYQVDLARYAFLDPRLVSAIDCIGGYPLLSRGFETTVPGLHIVGAPAARSFGPIMRFVFGSNYAARALTRRLPR